MRPSADVTSPDKAGSASTRTEVNASAKNATTSEVSAVCTVHCTVGVPESQFSGWRPVWLTANLDTARCRERKTPKVDRQGRVGGSNRVRQDSPSFSSFSPFVWGCHTESSANSVREVSQVSLQLTAAGRGLPGDRYQFWGWCPLNLKENRSSAAAQRANSTSVYVRRSTSDLGPVVLKRDHRKEMSTGRKEPTVNGEQPDKVRKAMTMKIEQALRNSLYT